MKLFIPSLLLFGAVIFTGLSAGLFYAWSISVIPGTLDVSHQTYLETMQSINRAILNPQFYAVFFGSMVFLSIASIDAFNTNSSTFWFLLGASILYLIGTIGVTSLGNVPLNDQLEVLKINELSQLKMETFRVHYEMQWNKFHLIRTVCAVLSFVLSVLALCSQPKTIQ
ncbi:MAG: DUF1772 domain-containing protein [Bacteroidota bacterium]